MVGMFNRFIYFLRLLLLPGRFYNGCCAVTAFRSCRAARHQYSARMLHWLTTTKLHWGYPPGITSCPYSSVLTDARIEWNSVIIRCKTSMKTCHPRHTNWNTTEKMDLAHPELGYDTTAIFD